MRRLPQIVKRSKHHNPNSSSTAADPIDSAIELLALFGRRIAPTILANIQEDVANIPPTALQENPTNISPTISQGGPADTSPAAPQDDPGNTSSAATQEQLANLPPTNPQQQILPALVAYEMD